MLRSSSVHIISSVHVVVGAQGLTAAASGCSRLLLLPHNTGQHVWTVKSQKKKVEN